jgi:hypothetical protein
MEKFYVITYDNGDMRAGYFNSGMEVLEYAKSLNVEYGYAIYEYESEEEYFNVNYADGE